MRHMATRYDCVLSCPNPLSTSRYLGQRTSGRSPMQNSASLQPSALASSAIFSTSSGLMVRALMLSSSTANVQYEHTSRHRLVSGMNTLRE